MQIILLTSADSVFESFIQCRFILFSTTSGLVFHTVAAGGDPEWKLVGFGNQRQASLVEELAGGSHD